MLLIIMIICLIFREAQKASCIFPILQNDRESSSSLQHMLHLNPAGCCQSPFLYLLPPPHLYLLCVHFPKVNALLREAALLLALRHATLIPNPVSACCLVFCMLQFPVAAKTNYHKLGGLKQHKFILNF